MLNQGVVREITYRKIGGKTKGEYGKRCIKLGSGNLLQSYILRFYKEESRGGGDQNNHLEKWQENFKCFCF